MLPSFSNVIVSCRAVEGVNNNCQLVSAILLQRCLPEVPHIWNRPLFRITAVVRQLNVNLDVISRQQRHKVYVQRQQEITVIAG